MSDGNVTHIDYERLDLRNESDVEQKVVMPLLSGDAYLAIPQRQIRTKDYLVPTPIDKAAGKNAGYFPDYSVWFSAFPVMIIEVKAPDVACEVGYREAAMYAQQLNQRYPTGVNPCQCILATNGIDLLFGHWDSQPEYRLKVVDVRPGSATLDVLIESCAPSALEAEAYKCFKAMRSKAPEFPYELAGGIALLNAKIPVNSFAADLSPILRRYFSNQEDVHEIAKLAYVNSAEVTEYDRVLQSLLKERLSIQRGTIVETLKPGKKGEERVAGAISDFDKERPYRGHLQIIQGSVGSGKSLFMHRYRDVLQSPEDEARTRWAFVDFNNAPPDLSSAYDWLCETFIEDFERENATIDLYAPQTQRGIFSSNILKRRSAYATLESASKAEAEIAKAKDLMAWQDDKRQFAKGIAEYILRGKKEILVVVMDNVDRLNLDNQLHAFQLTLSFLAETRCFVILQMRDETYERFKHKPPLDTFRSGIIFHISPPRFIDVAKRRLELSIEYLSTHAQDIQKYTAEKGMRVVYPKAELGYFLHELYLELFERRHNISTFLEALAGKDVRRALEMFVSIITSGHLSESAITSSLLGRPAPAQSRRTAPIREHNVLKILMRTDYKFASDQSGNITNMFRFDREWIKPDNFLLTEILYFLSMNRRRVSHIGIEGYWTCSSISDELQKLGYIPDDTLAALNYLLQRQLIGADHLNFADVKMDDSVKVLAAGFYHLRFLLSRLEYLWGVLPTTPIFASHVAKKIAHFVERESSNVLVPASEKAHAVEALYRYLVDQNKALREKQPLAPPRTGATMLLEMVGYALQQFKKRDDSVPQPGTELDIV